jgi:hypothetical protein
VASRSRRESIGSLYRLILALVTLEWLPGGKNRGQWLRRLETIRQVA